jgi:hypothetical protein
MVAQIAAEYRSDHPANAARSPRRESVSTSSNASDDEQRIKWTVQREHCKYFDTLCRRMEGGERVSYPEWLNLATHLHSFSELGNAEFHRLSAFDDRYDET